MNMISDLVLAMVARTTCRGARLADFPFARAGWRLSRAIDEQPVDQG
jgi:hypothetical protein